MKKLLALFVAALLIACASLALAEPVAIKALILPKFESGEMAGDFPGEAQYYLMKPTATAARATTWRAARIRSMSRTASPSA